jgi:hypothetical protein
MKPNDKELFDMNMAALATLCGLDISPLIGPYDAALRPLGYAAINRALAHILENRDGRDPFPSIKEIKRLIQPEQTQAQSAVEIAGKILKCVTYLGPYKTAEARREMGEIGWEVVTMSGGWESVCSIQDKDIPFNRGQWAKLAESLLARRPLVASSQIEGPKSPPQIDMAKLLKSMPKDGKL